VAGAAAVPDLEEDAAALGVHGVGDGAPAGDLGITVDAWFHPEGGISFHGHGGFCDDETGGSPLGVMFCHEGAGDVALFRAAAGQGGHEDAVGQRERARLERIEERRHDGFVVGDGRVGNGGLRR